MAQRRHHYERAFEAYVRLRRIPYVAVDEARRALLPEAAPPKGRRGRGGMVHRGDEVPPMPAGWPVGLKSFDFVLYGPDRNVLVDIKGRKVSRRMGGISSIREANARRQRSPQDGEAADGAVEEGWEDASAGESATGLGQGTAEPDGWRLNRRGRLESWVTQEDVDSLRVWQDLFGVGFESAFVFVYWCDEQPPDGLFQEVFDFQGRWYALRAIGLREYVSAMKARSARWRTVDLPGEAFERLSQPFAQPWVDGVRG